MVLFPTSGGPLPNTIAAGLIAVEIPFVVGKELSHFVMASTRLIVKILGKRRKGRACVVDRERSFNVRMDLSMMGTCSSRAQRWRLAGDNTRFNLLMLNSLSPCMSVRLKPLSLYKSRTIDNPSIICEAALLFNTCVVMKLIFPLLVWKKGILFTKKMSMYSEKLRWCLAMALGSGIF